jgi:hypothetical protein
MIEFSLVTIALLMMANGADTTFGKVCLTLTAGFALAAAVLTLPWESVF